MKLQFIKELINNNNMVLFSAKIHAPTTAATVVSTTSARKNELQPQQPLGPEFRVSDWLVTARGHLLHAAVTPCVPASIRVQAED